MVTVKELITMLKKLPADSTLYVDEETLSIVVTNSNLDLDSIIDLKLKPEGCGFTCGCED